MEGYTHLAELYGFRCYYNIHTAEVKGTNWINDKMIDLMVWADVTFFFNDGFEIILIREL